MFIFVTTAKPSLNNIPQLGGIMGEISNEPYELVEVDASEVNENEITYINPPFVSWVCDDHEKNSKLVFVATPIISGAKDISFELSEDGETVYINYTWPSSITNPHELFAHELGNLITATHPKVHTLISHLLSSGVSLKSRPRGKVAIKLPERVQREVGSWVKHAIKGPDGSKIILMEFKAYQEDIIIKTADTTINFD